MSQKAKNTDLSLVINEVLMANMNYALKTPLNAVAGMTDLLLKTNMDKDQKKFINIICDATETFSLQLENIIELSLSKSVAEKDKKVFSYAIKDIVKESFQNVSKKAAAKNIALFYDIDLELPDLIIINKNKLKLALTNILIVVLYLTEHREITLRIKQFEHKEEKYLRVLLDHGTPIYEAYKNISRRLQDIEEASLEIFGELTISLLTFQKLLQQLEGKIFYDTAQPKNSLFGFDVKIRKGSASFADTAYAVLKGKKALVLQRDLSRLNMLVNCLELWDVRFHIIEAQDDLLQEIELAKTENRAYDLLFCNNTLHGPLLTKCKKEIPHIVMITEDSSKEQIWLNEFAATFEPPIYPEELMKVLASFYVDIENSDNFKIDDEPEKEGGKKEKKLKAIILFAEDDFVNRFYITELLESFGCRVVAVDNGSGVIHQLQNSINSYDIVLMDCIMPEMDGYEATRTIRTLDKNADIPVIALTANTLISERDKCKEAGMDDFLQKPLKEDDLFKMLQKHLQRKRAA